MSLVLLIGYLVSHQTVQLVYNPYSESFIVKVQGSPIGTVVNGNFEPRDYHFKPVYALNSKVK